MESLTIAEFIKRFRPDGFGYIHIDGKEIAKFTEIICDSCNDLLEQPKDDSEKKVVFLPDEAHAWCDECAGKYGKFSIRGEIQYGTTKK